MILYILISFTDILSIVILSGCLISGIYIIARIDNYFYYNFCGKIRIICFLSLLLLLAENLLYLNVASITFSQKSFLSSIEFIPAVLFSTHFGLIWIIKFSSIIIFLLILLLSKKIFENRFSSFVTLLLLLIISFGRSAVSHSADRGDFTIPQISDFIHLISASFWGGSIIIFSILIIPGFKNHLQNNEKQIVLTIKRLSITATICIVLIVITAVINAWYETRSIGAFFFTSYGRTALLKLVCLIIITVIASLNHYLSIPVLQDLARITRKRLPGEWINSFFKLKRGRSFENEIKKIFGRIIIEAVLIVIVLMLAAILVNQIPSKDVKKNITQSFIAQDYSKIS